MNIFFLHNSNINSTLWFIFFSSHLFPLIFQINLYGHWMLSDMSTVVCPGVRYVIIEPMRPEPPLYLHKIAIRAKEPQVALSS